MQTATMLMTPEPVMSRRSASTAGIVLAGRPDAPPARNDPFWTFMVTAGALSDSDLTWEEQRDRLREAFSALLGQFGVAAFSYHIVQCPSLSAVTNPPASIVSTMPARWSGAYEDEFLGADPVLAKATATRMPFTWRELEAAAPGTETERRFFRHARHCGLIDCLTIPVHVERGIAALTMAPGPGGAAQMRTHERLLFLAAYHFHQRIRRPVVEVTLAVSPRRRSLLSPRETQILERAACGRSSDQIARDLAIAPKSVEFHLEGAKRKLQVANRTHAVAKAIMLGLVTPDRHQ